MCASTPSAIKVLEIKLSDYDPTFNLDVRSVVDMIIQTFDMVISAKGNIINLSTMGTTHRAENPSMCQGAKAAVENFSVRHADLQGAVRHLADVGARPRR